MIQRKRIGPAQAFFYAHLYDVTDDCMIWPYGTGRGYGMVSIGGRTCRVHVLACTAHHGPRPAGMVAAHGPCHNPSCWNGGHVSWKTHTENLADRLRDGTAQIGEVNGGAKLTAREVRAIRATYAGGGITQRQLATVYGISQSQVSRIVIHEKWAHLSA